MVQQIIDSEAELVTLSEVRNYSGVRFCDRIVQSLAEKGHCFYSFYSYDSGILSRYPITDSACVYPENNDHGSIYKAVVKIGARELAVYTAHLDYLRCAYYMVKGYDGSTWQKYDRPFTDIDSILRVNVASERDDAIRAFLAEAGKDRQLGRIVILGGDFNEPSHLDWVEQTKNSFERQGLVIPWTVSTLLAEAGYLDAYRVRHPNPVTHPGITYPADCPGAPVEQLSWAPEADEQERIDFVYCLHDKNLQLKDAVIWGPRGTINHSRRVQEPTSDPFNAGAGIWPSDHKGLLATFTLQ